MPVARPPPWQRGVIEAPGSWRTRHGGDGGGPSPASRAARRAPRTPAVRGSPRGAARRAGTPSRTPGRRSSARLGSPRAGRERRPRCWRALREGVSGTRGPCRGADPARRSCDRRGHPRRRREARTAGCRGVPSVGCLAARSRACPEERRSGCRGGTEAPEAGGLRTSNREAAREGGAWASRGEGLHEQAVVAPAPTGARQVEGEPSSARSRRGFGTGAARRGRRDARAALELRKLVQRGRRHECEQVVHEVRDEPFDRLPQRP